MGERDVRPRRLDVDVDSERAVVDSPALLRSTKRPSPERNGMSTPTLCDVPLLDRLPVTSRLYPTGRNRLSVWCRGRAVVRRDRHARRERFHDPVERSLPSRTLFSGARKTVGRVRSVAGVPRLVQDPSDGVSVPEPTGSTSVTSVVDAVVYVMTMRPAPPIPPADGLRHRHHHRRQLHHRYQPQQWSQSHHHRRRRPFLLRLPVRSHLE